MYKRTSVVITKSTNQLTDFISLLTNYIHSPSNDTGFLLFILFYYSF